jgi:hypothetical protein
MNADKRKRCSPRRRKERKERLKALVKGKEN